MQMRNFVKEKIAANGYVLGAFVASSSATNCEILAINGLDFVLIDCEHAQTDAETLVHMCRASEMYGMAPLMRVYNPDDGPMMSRMLDVGLHGVMAPLINTPVQAQNLVNFTKYAPLGKRGRQRRPRSTLGQLPRLCAHLQRQRAHDRPVRVRAGREKH